MDDYTKIQIEYFQESLDYLEKCIKTLYQIKGINLDSKRFFVRPKLNPQLYLDNNRQTKKELLSLDKIFLMPEVGQFFETNVRSTVHIDEFIKYAEDSRKWLVEQIVKIRFPESSTNIDEKSTKLIPTPSLRNRFKRNELKALCSKIAEDLKLIKGDELTQNNILEVCKRLEEMNYVVIEKSVATALRDKLGYRKEKY